MSSVENQRKQRIIFHVDMDSFYASCELAKSPSLKDSPFIVGADPKEGKGRGVVLACNYPARKFGVRSGMPISRAWELCSNAKYVPPNFTLYGEVSERVMKILRSFTEKMEQVSIDEAYLEFSDENLNPKSTDKARGDSIKVISSQIKSKVRSQESITCSIGVSNSKIIAKIATDMNKPDGLTVIENGKEREFLAPLPVEKIPGVGKVTQKVLLDKFKVKTIDDLRKVPLDLLTERFGRTALWLHSVSIGVDNSPVIPHWEPVSESSETTFDDDVSDHATIEKVMKDVAEEVHRRTMNDGFLFRSIGIKIRFSGFETHTRSKTLNAPTESLDVVIRECQKMLSEFVASGKNVRLIGVRLSGLEKKQNSSQLTLIEWSGNDVD